MVEAEEVHYKLASGSGECARVKQVKCARVYHLNLVLRVKTRNLPDAEQDVRDTNKVMHMERARLVVNQQGILRLQSLGELTSVFLHQAWVDSIMQTGPILRGARLPYHLQCKSACCIPAEIILAS